MNKEFANKVYTVLVEQLRAPELGRESFIYAVTDLEYPCKEWRFQGLLGFGGKYWPERNIVNCYQEDETPGRLALIEVANEELKRLENQ